MQEIMQFYLIVELFKFSLFTLDICIFSTDSEKLIYYYIIYILYKNILILNYLLYINSKNLNVQSEK